jgi:uncharacterized repeat protein (TIGR03803 family)
MRSTTLDVNVNVVSLPQAQSNLQLILKFLFAVLSMALMVVPGAEAQLIYNVLHTFQGGTDGSFPAGNLTVVQNPTGVSLFGTTSVGGGSGCYQGGGCGTAFRVSALRENVLYSFTNGADGSDPQTGVLITGGNRYVVTPENSFPGCSPCSPGTLVRLNSTGGATTLWTFGGPNDGLSPSSSLIADRAGNLYGTTVFSNSSPACSSGCGTVYQFNLRTNSETVLYTFQGGSDGEVPGGQLARDRSGNLYGTTTSGGGTGCFGHGCGTVFKLAPCGVNCWNESILYSFQGQPNDGQEPSGLILVGSTLYGYTTIGGANNLGTLFQINVNTGVEKALYNFASSDKHGIIPGGLVFDSATKSLYGVAEGGGANSFGTFFHLTFGMNGSFTDLYDFVGGATGSAPVGLAEDSFGNFYGVASGGITNANCKFGCGIVYEITPP